MEQNNGKFRLKLNLFDGIVLIAALAVGAFLLWNAFKPAPAASSGTASPSTSTVRDTIRFQRLMEGTGSLIQPGDALVEIYRQAGFPVVQVSAETGTGIPELCGMLSGKLSAFTGNSGVGKSSLLNAVEPGFALQVAEVSEKLGRGRHTTRHVALYRLSCGGYVIDTPGFSSFDEGELGLALKERLPETFLEFRPYLGQCRFVGCGHTREKGCAVLAAVKEGKIPRSRHESYLRLYEELKDLRSWNQKEQK